MNETYLFTNEDSVSIEKAIELKAKEYNKEERKWEDIRCLKIPPSVDVRQTIPEHDKTYLWMAPENYHSGFSYVFFCQELKNDTKAEDIEKVIKNYYPRGRTQIFFFEDNDKIFIIGVDCFKGMLKEIEEKFGCNEFNYLTRKINVY